MEEKDEWLRSRATLALLMSSGLTQAGAVERLRSALAAGLVRGRVILGFVGPVAVRDWDAPRSVWVGDLFSSWLSLQHDEFQSSGTEIKAGGPVKLTGLSFHLGDMLRVFDVGRSAPSSVVEPQAAIATTGRKKGQVFYEGDADMVGRIIGICDEQSRPLRTVINDLVREIEPVGQDNDASKKRRIREKVLAKRPDLRAS